MTRKIAISIKENEYNQLLTRKEKADAYFEEHPKSKTGRKLEVYEEVKWRMKVIQAASIVLQKVLNILNGTTEQSEYSFKLCMEFNKLLVTRGGAFDLFVSEHNGSAACTREDKDFIPQEDSPEGVLLKLVNEFDTAFRGNYFEQTIYFERLLEGLVEYHLLWREKFCSISK